MSQAELEIGRTVIRTVKFEFGPADLERMAEEYVKRAHGVKLRDFTLTAVLNEHVCVVTGEARTDGLAPTRKRKAKA